MDRSGKKELPWSGDNNSRRATLKRIMVFALPLAVSGILQQLFTSADMAIIFLYEGTVAQSAVNSNGALVNLLINLFSGMSVGVTFVVAEHVGKRHTDDLHSVTLTALVIAVTCGMALLGVGVAASAPLLKLMDTPADTLPLATDYLRIYFIGMPFLMVYNFGAAALRGVGDTKKALIILLSTGVLNLGLNVLFVAACNMSVSGVATATVIANLVSAVMVVIFLMRDGRFRLRKGVSRVRLSYIKRIAAIGLPAGLQGTVFSVSNVLIQSSINSFGACAVAGSGDAVNFENIVYFFTNAFAQTAVTFVGQEYSAGNYDRCKRLYNLCMLTSMAVAAVLSVIFTAGGRWFIRIYTTDDAAIEYAILRMKCVLLGAVLSCLYEVPGGAMRGMGHSFLPALFTIIGSCVLRIIWIYTVFAATQSYSLLLIVYPISWTVTGAAMLISYYIICRKAGFYAKTKTATDCASIASETAEATGTVEQNGETAYGQTDAADEQTTERTEVNSQDADRAEGNTAVSA